MTRLFSAIGWLLLATTATTFLRADEAEPVIELEDYEVLGLGIDSRRIVPANDIASPLGGQERILRIPRSLTMVTNEQLEAFGIRTAEDITQLAASIFSSSLFGISGTPDIRGANGETYYRGMKRADNRALFPQPIGAAQRLEVVKGPPSPLFGPGALGGFINFVPKSARAEEGLYVEGVVGQLSLQYGSHEQRIVDAEIGGALDLGGDRRAGYYLYGSYEDSDSYYEGGFDELGLFQGSFVAELTDFLRLETGGQVQTWDGTEIAGLNRITQDLIDHGRYETGSAYSTDINGDPLDRDGNGRLSANEVIMALSLPDTGNTVDTDPVLRFTSIDPATNRGVVTIDRSKSLLDPGDSASMEGALGFFDLIYDRSEGWSLENKLFFDTYDSEKLTSQGFNGLADATVVENKFLARLPALEAGPFSWTNSLVANVRHHDADRAQAYDLQNFNRRDIASGGTVADRFPRYSENGQEEYPFTELWNTEYTSVGIGWLTRFTFWERLQIDLGLRRDRYDVDHRYTRRDFLFVGTPIFSTLLNNYGSGYDPLTQTPADTFVTRTQSGTADGLSYHASATFEIVPRQLSAYVTYARQKDVNRGEAGEYSYQIPAADPVSIADNFLSESSLWEAGLKALLFEDALYVSLAAYELSRPEFDPRATVPNDYRNRGLEAEFRWAVTRGLSLFAHGNVQESEYLTSYADALPANGGNGYFFTVHPSFGGQDITAPGGLLDSSFDIGGLAFNDARYAGNEPDERKSIPQQVYSVGGTYVSEFGLGTALAVTYKSEQGLARPWFVTLPEYFLGTFTLFYQADHWTISGRVKNLFDEDYWQNTAPNSLGGGTVISMPPRTYEITLTLQL